MEKQANIKRIPFTFNVGDQVLLKHQPYRQQIVTRRTSEKLTKIYFGPFQIINRVEEVAFMLDLPSSSRIHHVVHVSLLRPYFGSNPTGDFKPLPSQKPYDFLEPHQLPDTPSTHDPEAPSVPHGFASEVRNSTSSLLEKNVSGCLEPPFASKKNNKNTFEGHRKSDFKSF
ncbi:unnamed protein product [Vicia faba]|uniref:Tf2-1-like SH3-like domain-containing protein n=1 Tax=Vicia faba TaxID=3906 RepID=A0AAV1B2P0_VICFA|nr:unnamed protein product [Vicia faba]